ncbi:MAG: DUF4190 domain-containing protein [Sphingobacteriales bacterium]|jgi:hypothetical protein|nr:DUF4190 domain-containing protein [Sphingobacteriales bacterium]
MKTTLRNAALLVAFFFVGNIAQASFPYKENAKEQKKSEIVVSTPQDDIDVIAVEGANHSLNLELGEKDLIKNTEQSKNDGSWLDKLMSNVLNKKQQIKNKLDEGGSNGMAIAGFVCSLAGLLIFGLILGTLGIIFSSIGLAKYSKTGKGLGFAITGLVVGILDIVLTLVFLAAIA